MKKVKALPRHLRPREKLISLGAANLTLTELIAVILGSGTQKYSVMDVAHQLVKKYDYTSLRTLTLRQLEVPGLGQIQASKIIAALELGKRVMTEVSQTSILCPDDVLNEVKEIRHKSREHLLALYLNARHEIVHKEVLTIGGLNFNS